MAYARETQVPIERSKAEIEKILMRYGATGFAYAARNDAGNEQAVIIFQVKDRRVRFNLPLPRMSEFKEDKRGWERRQDVWMKLWSQACRSRWRALALVIKAKLEAVESGITVFEEEFLAHLVTSGGRTVGERLIPELGAALKTPASLPMLPGSRESSTSQN